MNALLLTLAILSGASAERSRPATITPAPVVSDCNADGCDGVVRKLTPDVEIDAVENGRRGAEELILLKKKRKVIIHAQPPVIEYTACFFRVVTSNFGNTCAAGVTVYQSFYIMVSTRDGWLRTKQLVEWEARNWFLCKSGHCDLAI